MNCVRKPGHNRNESRRGRRQCQCRCQRHSCRRSRLRRCRFAVEFVRQGLWVCCRQAAAPKWKLDAGHASFRIGSRDAPLVGPLVPARPTTIRKKAGFELK